jgi:predicted short-subunit dehydrogenase-like oxidoreductase (DUF2520 family)
MKIAIVGAGRLAHSLAPALQQAGYSITTIISTPRSLRKASKLAKTVGALALTAKQAEPDAGLVWFCVPDRKIRTAAKELAHLNWKNKQAFHSSGALSSDELGILKKRGAAVASVHPFMTFVSNSKPGLKAVPFALEGDRIAVATAKKIAQRLGGSPFAIRKQDKTLYHAWGTFASPLLIALLATTEQVAGAWGVSSQQARKKMLPILRQTLNNYAKMGTEKSFSGPIIRGDSQVIAQHLEALQRIPHAEAVYRALARSALQYLTAKNRKQLSSMVRIQK